MNEQEMNQRVKKQMWQAFAAFGFVATALAAVLIIKEVKSIAYVGKDTPITDSISVNGKGEEISVPDVATFSFSVTETAKTVADAQSQATAKINAALKSVRDAGVADKDIQTLSYNINPHYEYTQGICTQYSCPGSKSVLTGYDVSQSIGIKVRDLAKAGALFTTVGSQGVQNINSLTFSIDDIDTVKGQARAKAIDNAEAKAKELASQLGVTLVRITSFYESGDQRTPIAYGMMNEAVSKDSIAPAAPEVPAGEQKVVSNVTITYEIR